MLTLLLDKPVLWSFPPVKTLRTKRVSRQKKHTHIHYLCVYTVYVICVDNRRTVLSTLLYGVDLENERRCSNNLPCITLGSDTGDMAHQQKWSFWNKKKYNIVTIRKIRIRYPTVLVKLLNPVGRLPVIKGTNCLVVSEFKSKVQKKKKPAQYQQWAKAKQTITYRIITIR